MPRENKTRSEIDILTPNSSITIKKCQYLKTGGRHSCEALSNIRGLYIKQKKTEVLQNVLNANKVKLFLP